MRSCMEFAFCAIAGLLLCALKVPAQMVRGTPGVDYPNYHTIPSQTSFKCSEQKYIPGFYADVETDCQVFHFCFDNRYESFLCPTGTTFNQPILACDMWYNSNCTLAPLFYVMNAGPGIRSAEKKIPMLLKLRDQAKDGVTTMASTSSVFEQISGLKENVHENTQILDEGTATVTIDDLESESDVSNDTDAKVSGVIKFENSLSDNQRDQSAEQLENADHESLINILYSRKDKSESQDELNDESKVPDLMYDPVTDGYYTQNDYSSDSEWQSESQPNSQYQGFYDLNNQMMQDEGESVQFNDNYEDEAYAGEGNEYSEEQNEKAPENIVFDGNYMRQGEYYDGNQFSERFQIPRYSRRKPTYFVVDQPEMSQTRQGLNLYPGLGSTESPYSESISIDSVVEESSTESMEFADDEFETDKDSNYEINEPDEYFENDSEDSNLNSGPESDLEPSDLEGDWETSEETEKFQDGENRVFNTESNFSEENESDNEENEQNSNNAEGESEDITIYDDSYPEEYDGVEQNAASDLSNEQDTLIVVPDETDFPTTPEGGAVDPSNDNDEYETEDPNQNWQYVYSEASETPQNVDPGDARYMYNEIERNEQGLGEMEYSETYDPSQYAAQRNYAYPGIYDDINYSQYQPPVYSDQLSQNYVPENYYQYAPKDREYFSEQGPPEVSYGMPEGNLVPEENSEPSEFGPMTSAFSRSPNVPGNLYSYQSLDNQPYGYNYDYPQMQDGYMNGYPHSPQYGYPYQNSDRNLYYNRGDERQPSFENEYVTESSDTGLPLDQEYEGLQQTWAQTDFESENSETQTEGEAENVPEFETDGYTLSYDELGSERPNSEFNVQDAALLDNSEGTRQNEETYYVIEDEDGPDADSDDSSHFDVRKTTEEIETESNKTSDVDHKAQMPSGSSVVYEDTEKDGFEPLKANVAGVYSDSESMLNIPDEGKRDDEISEFGIKTDSKSLDTNSNPIDSWQSHGFNINKENAKPVETSTLERLAGLKPKVPSGRDFIAPTETQFLNSMQFPNAMDFGPYGYGANMGQQFSMMDSSNMAPFGKTENRIPSEASDSGMSRLSKLSTFQDKVRSMKGGKFGMFKKYMNSMKN